MRRLGRAGVAAFAGELLQSSRDWLETTFASERAHGVLAPWVLHTGLGPDAATSGFMTQVIAVAVQEGGMPIPRGGGAKLADALVQLIRDHGGVCETGGDVERVLVRSGRAVGVRLADGETVEAERAVDRERDADAALRAAARRRRRAGAGRARARAASATAARRCRSTSRSPSRRAGTATSGWTDTAIVHVTPGLDGVSRAVNEAERGLLPAEATIVVGQPLTIDPSPRARRQGAALDPAAGAAVADQGRRRRRARPGDGEWTDDLRERYADRIQARLARHIPNLESSILQRVALGPHDLERVNVNLRHGDPYGGALTLDQNFLWRPFPRSPGHATPVERLWHIGASTWPGPGLGAGSGTLVAAELLEPPLSQRAAAKAEGSDAALGASTKPRRRSRAAAYGRPKQPSTRRASTIEYSLPEVDAVVR